MRTSHNRAAVGMPGPAWASLAHWVERVTEKQEMHLASSSYCNSIQTNIKCPSLLQLWCMIWCLLHIAIELGPAPNCPTGGAGGARLAAHNHGEWLKRAGPVYRNCDRVAASSVHTTQACHKQPTRQLGQLHSCTQV